MYRKQKPAGKKGNLSQFGLLDIPDLDDGDEPLDLSDDDMDFEAELAAISGGGAKSHRPRKPAPVPAANLDAMIAESLKDIPSDEDVSDEDDPDLLNELQGLAGEDEDTPAPPRTSRPAPPPPGMGSAESSTVSLLQERISNYTLAEKNAKASGESGRARRFNRALKTLNDQLKQARAGKAIPDEDIPPPVSTGKPSPAAAIDSPPPRVPPRNTSIEAPSAPPRSTSMESPSAPEQLIDLGHDEEPPSQPEPKEPPPPPPNELSPERKQGLMMIMKRQAEFKAAALSCKHSGDKAMALEYLKVVKQFDMVVEAYRSGQEMDLNELPTPEMIATALKSGRTEETTQQSAEPDATPTMPEEPAGLVTASTVDEALRQRLAYFQQQEAASKEAGNSSKARRMGRIVKQFQEAIKLNSAGKPIAGDELPTPPGYAALPADGSSSAAAAPRPAPRPAPSPSPAPSTGPAPTPKPATSRYDKQIAFLLQRQKQFKEAAIKAKKEGDIDKAKEYLRAAKGFDSVIEAARGGLAVDLKSLPLLPKAKTDLEHTFDVVSAEDCDPSPSAGPISADDDDVIARLHQQLSTQLKLCLANRDHNQAMGHIADANRFDHLAISVKQDLDLVTVAKSLGETPKFHYESRNFSMVQCNTDLNENDLELTIVRGIAFNVPNPKEIDTYVKFEFPYPQEAPVTDRTSTVKDTNCPQYNAVFPLSIHRGARPCLRVFKRHAIKLEVYSKGGWFRGDSLLGAAQVKLAPLESSVTIHDSFPLMDGRRPAGGSVEVKLRVRTPLVQPQVENTTHRWLVIDN